MHNVPDLPYAYDALEPYIDAETMRLHHDKHHSTYVDNLNKALKQHKEYQNRPIEQLLTSLSELPDDIRAAVRNNGGGHYNHSLFWTIMAPVTNTTGPSEVLSVRLEREFGSVDALKDTMKAKALSQFGSGWAWVVTDGKALQIVGTANQDTPLSDGQTPILGIDVWEHAYYLKYQNRRAEYFDNWWHTINWAEVERRLGVVGRVE